MLDRDYPEQDCSIARALEVVGERWSLLIVRDLFLGIHRYEDLVRSLGIARNILQTRLNLLAEEGVVEKRPYAEGRYEYRLTKKGRDLWAPLMSLMKWGDRYYAEEGAPRVFRHRECGGRMDDRLNCRKCGAALDDRNIYFDWGPGATEELRETRTALEAASSRSK